MQTATTAMPDALDETRERVIEHALPHVAFDGWSTETLRRAAEEAGVDQGLAQLAFPRGAIDLALGYHHMLDRRLAAELAGTDLARLPIRERVTHAVRRRLEMSADDREAVRRGATLTALPHHAAEGARAIWQTSDLIWNACGDTATDYNWYTKRAILASVYSATLLYWLGDESPGFSNTWAFLDRRIEGVMRFEKTKAALQKNPLVRTAFWGPMQVLKLVKAPPGSQQRG